MFDLNRRPYDNITLVAPIGFHGKVTHTNSPLLHDMSNKFLLLGRGADKQQPTSSRLEEVNSSVREMIESVSIKRGIDALQ